MYYIYYMYYIYPICIIRLIIYTYTYQIIMYYELICLSQFSHLVRIKHVETNSHKILCGLLKITKDTRILMNFGNGSGWV